MQIVKAVHILVVYAYEQALLCLGYYPDVWYEASQFLQEASKKLEAKGDVKTSQQFTAETIRKYTVVFLLKDE